MNKYFACVATFLLVMLTSMFCFRFHPARFASAEESSCIYLTFDDGPSDRVTPKILDVLKEKKVNGTFFVVGSHVEYRPALTQRIVEEGNSVGIHSYSHDYKQIYASPTALLCDVEKCSRVLQSIGIYTRLYRFPGGSFMADERFASEVKKKGYVYVDWNALCGDSESAHPTARQLYERAVQSGADRKKIIMLFHDATDKSATAEALPDIIDYYRDRNYEFCTFDMA